ncbi:hypothetical protein [Pseudomonas sp. CJQ_13]|uniref:hypothetical protein n=1 Tax=Pseudomonas sp. CJQ_13 TaxID=3367170 RepID=UPI00370AE9E2
MSLREAYYSDAEAQYLAERKAQTQQKAADILIKNSLLVGEVKEYKGVRYQMNQRGNYVCLDLPTSSKLDGAFTSTQILHSIIDKLEADGAPVKAKVKTDK